MKVVILLVGALLIVIGLIRDGLTLFNNFAAFGLLLFCLGGASYFIAWPVSQNEEQKWRFNLDFAWFFIYLVVIATSVYWLRLLLR